jgi:hypothetical protein
MLLLLCFVCCWPLLLLLPGLFPRTSPTRCLTAYAVAVVLCVLLPFAAPAAAARRVAVEVDGPAHFTNSLPHSLLGSSLAKQRCLQARGWAVLSVPYFTWEGLAKQQQQQQNAAGVSLKPSRSTLASRSNKSSSMEPTPTVKPAGVCAADSNGGGGGGDATVYGTHDAGSAVLAARARWLAAALDEAVALADVPKGMPHLRQLVDDAMV